MTGIPDLGSDTSLEGGGLHQSSRGGSSTSTLTSRITITTNIGAGGSTSFFT